jgi:hypothetical protein
MVNVCGGGVGGLREDFDMQQAGLDLDFDS